MDKTKTLFYFGYGSNMSTQYLIRRRKITPMESQVALLKDYELIMNMEGPNFLEPSFANIRACKGSKVEGVIHRIDENSDNPANVCADVDSNARISVSFTFRAQ